MSQQKKAFDDIFSRVWNDGKLVRPRGLLVREAENFTYTLPPYVRFQNYACRKLNLSYLKREVAWYLKGDRFDTSICQHAKTWQGIVNDDGSINSNYGQYVFRTNVDVSKFWGKRVFEKKISSQFDNVVDILSDDKDSRRASIVILNSSHLLSDTKDVPCTYSLNFRIRDDKLNMSVHMRSQDAIFGMGNDAPAFSIIHEMVMNALKPKYPTIELGNYFHVADSFHVYERHFGMLEKIIEGDEFTDVEVPRISGHEEVNFLINAMHLLPADAVPDNFKFTKWLIDV